MNQIDIVGAGSYGLFATHQAAKAYPNTQVDVYEQWPLPLYPNHRKGTGQDRQVHVLPAALTDKRMPNNIFDEFPSLKENFIKYGVPQCRRPYNLMLYYYGWVNRFADDWDVTTWQPSRPLLEFLIRQEVAKHKNVRFLTGNTVVGLDWSEDKTRVQGIRYYGQSRSNVQISKANLVVMATGRSGARHVREWLTTAGYQVPDEESIDSFVTYTSWKFKRVAFPYGVTLMAVADTEENPRAVVIIQQEDGVLVTAVGIGGIKPPTDLDGFLEFVKSCHQQAYDVLAGQETLWDRAYAFSDCQSVRTQYSLMPVHPIGLILGGDGVNTTNPRWGKGIINAWRAALCLMEYFKHQSEREYFISLDNALAGPWTLATSADAKYYPNIQINEREPLYSEVSRTLLIRKVYMRHLERLHAEDAVGRQFARVSNEYEGPASLLSPQFLFLTAKRGVQRIIRH